MLARTLSSMPTPPLLPKAPEKVPNSPLQQRPHQRKGNFPNHQATQLHLHHRHQPIHTLTIAMRAADTVMKKEDLAMAVMDEASAEAADVVLGDAVASHSDHSVDPSALVMDHLALVLKALPHSTSATSRTFLDSSSD